MEFKMSSTFCQFCQKDQFKYTCPKCNALYCSVSCYKSPEHLKCSEEFYKSCIQEELIGSESNSSNDMKKMYDILKRMHEGEAGLEPDFDDEIDSDDEGADSDNSDECAQNESGDEQDMEDIATRMQNVDINDADEIWQRLTAEERADFKKMVDCGEIMKLLPSFKPWWVKPKYPKIVEVTAEKSDLSESHNVPEIEKNIPKFTSICKKTPSTCLHYNLWNIICSYSFMVRYFNGEHCTSPMESVAHLVNLSSTLKFGTNFEDTEDAIVSVEMEALTSKNFGIASTACPEVTAFEASREQLESDARSLMSSIYHKLAALSDIYRLIVLARNYLKLNKSTFNGDFHKLFALSNGSVELDRKKLLHLTKKMEFFLSYVNREIEERLE